MDYGCVIWDNCYDKENYELEKVQLAATRMGAKKGTSHNPLYSETMIEPLAARRDRRKLTQLYKIKRGKI